MPNPSDHDWTDADLKQLREFWAEDKISTAEMGRRLGVSKNAVVGMAHRLDLPSRPSPIKRREDGSVALPPLRPLPAGARTIPMLPSELAALEAEQS